jgi:hypothetical protein
MQGIPVSRPISRFIATACAGLALLVVTGISLQADALKLRRPYDPNIAFTYGYDNNFGSAGCLDFNCGSICYDGHRGVDHPLVLGTTVRAGEEGTVVQTYNGCANYGYVNNSCGGYCGNHVKIRHANGDITLYCHMKLNSLTVSNGDRVSCGQKLGLSASSGSSTGPHLHVSWITSGGAWRDLFRGQCTNSPGAWREQRGYRQAVGTSCGCTPSAEVCDGRDNDCDGDKDENDVCENRFLRRAPASYAQPTTTDVNGDGLQDACGRFPDGWRCYLATGDGWGAAVESGVMPDSNGWGHPRYYATIRTGDVDGDGLADVCGRHSTQGYKCWRSTGDGFEHYADAPGYTNQDNWDQPQYYTTFRLADVNGDGKDDVCARGPAGWSCQLSTGAGFGDRVDGPNWDDDSGYDRARYYGTIRTGDLDADGKDDVCIRRAAGFDCFRSTGTGFERFALIEHFSNEGGWDDMIYWSTLRLADYDGDGKDDVCARFYSGIRCLRSTDSGFAGLDPVADLSTESGWDDPTNYQTLRVGDVNGDGAQDFCLRANAGMRCYGLENGAGFSISGPDWSDEWGWDAPKYYQTITVTDIDADRRRDLCGRGSAGLHCVTAEDGGFAAIDALGAFSNDKNWDQAKYYSTLRLGTGECSAEVCNGFDDDCDGSADEGAPTEMGPAPPALAAAFVDAVLPETARAGKSVQATVRFRNVGRDAWSAGQLKLQTVATDPALIDALRPSAGWPEADVVATTSAEIAPGEVAVFTFPLLVPADSSVFDQVLFVLSAADRPIACPSPTVTLSLGVTTGDDDADTGVPNSGGPDAGTSDAGKTDAGYSDAGDDSGDESGRDSNMSVSTSAFCSATDSSSPLSSPWPGILAVFGLFWLRRRKFKGDKMIAANSSKSARVARIFAIVLSASILLIGCDAGVESSGTSDESSMTTAKTAQELHGAQLLAIYGPWELRGRLLPVPPRSDASGKFIATLTRDGEPVAWPLAERPITAAAFVPNAKTPSVVVRTPGADLLHVDLSKGTVAQLDHNAGRMIAASANGCCVAYMTGGIGLQYNLRIADLREDEVRDIRLDHMAWSPAISPDADAVVYVAVTPDGRTGIYKIDLAAASPESRLLAVDPVAFPTGPQPPFWTRRGIAFSSERGAYLMSPDARILAQNPEARGLLVDLSDGDLLNAAGDELEMQPIANPHPTQN